MERAPLGFCLMLRTPPGTPATHVRPRPGPEHGPGTTLSIFVEPPINVFTHMRATSRRRPVGRRKRSLCGPALTRRDLGGSTTFSAPLHCPAFCWALRWRLELKTRAVDVERGLPVAAVLASCAESGTEPARGVCNS